MSDPKIILNAVICVKCGDLVRSTHRHDFRPCTCGAIYVDGGLDYLRRLGDIHGCIDASLYEGEEDKLQELNERTKTERLGVSEILEILRRQPAPKTGAVIPRNHSSQEGTLV